MLAGAEARYEFLPWMIIVAILPRAMYALRTTLLIDIQAHALVAHHRIIVIIVLASWHITACWNSGREPLVAAKRNPPPRYPHAASWVVVVYSYELNAVLFW